MRLRRGSKLGGAPAQLQGGAPRQGSSAARRQSSERSLDLRTMFSKSLSDKEMTKLKVIELDEYYNFYVHDFLSSNHLVYQNFV